MSAAPETTGRQGVTFEPVQYIFRSAFLQEVGVELFGR